MIPLKDDTPKILKPAVAVALIVVCVSVFVWQLGLSGQKEHQAVFALGFIPGVFFDGRALPPELSLVPWPVTLLTYQFLHGGWWHLIGNMLYLWVFGPSIEDAMGHRRFLAFYLICGVLAAAVQGAVAPTSQWPMIGASGAVSGVLGAYIMLHPRANILVLIPIVIIFWTARLPALIVLGLWFLLQFVNATGGDGGSEVAFWAHVGGFIAGMALIHLFRKRPPAPPPGRRHRLIPDSGI
ncbi:rhomboid family intramembrane serine protease [Magnetospira thiophila]